MNEKIKLTTIDMSTKSGVIEGRKFIKEYCNKKNPVEGDYRIVSNGIKFAIEEYIQETQTNLFYLMLFISKYEWYNIGEYFCCFEDANKYKKDLEECKRIANLEWKEVTHG